MEHSPPFSSPASLLDLPDDIILRIYAKCDTESRTQLSRSDLRFARLYKERIGEIARYAGCTLPPLYLSSFASQNNLKFDYRSILEVNPFGSNLFPLCDITNYFFRPIHGTDSSSPVAWKTKYFDECRGKDECARAMGDFMPVKLSLSSSRLMPQWMLELFRPRVTVTITGFYFDPTFAMQNKIEMQCKRFDKEGNEVVKKVFPSTEISRRIEKVDADPYYGLKANKYKIEYSCEYEDSEIFDEYNFVCAITAKKCCIFERPSIRLSFPSADEVERKQALMRK